jgi:hypothetical protein
MTPAAKRARKEIVSKKSIKQGPESKISPSPEEPIAQQSDEVSLEDNDKGDNESDSESLTTSNTSTDTETEIYQAQNAKSKKTASKYCLD